MEKIDKVRQTAGKTLQGFLKLHAKDIPQDTPDLGLLTAIFTENPKIEQEDLHGREEALVFGTPIVYLPWRNP